MINESNTIYDHIEIEKEKEIIVNESKSILDVLKTKTGEGTISEYLNHPLNFDESEATARIIRGITGIVGATDIAIVDIIFGLLKHITILKKRETA